MKKYVFIGSVLRPLHVLINIGIGFYMMPFLIHNLGERFYGFWCLTSTIVGYFLMMDFNISTAVSKYISEAIGKEKNSDIPKIINTSLRIYLVIALLIVFMTIILTRFIENFVPAGNDLKSFQLVILFMGLSSVLSMLSKPFLGALNAYLRFDSLFMCSFTSLVLKSGLIITVVKLGHSLVAMSVVVLISSVYSFFFQIIAYLKATKLKLPRFIRLDKCYFKKISSYSATAFVAVIADILRFQVDNLVISAFLGLTAVAHYAVASNLSRYFFDIMRNIVSVLTPVFSRIEASRDFPQMSNLFQFSLKLCTIFAIFLGGGISIFGSSFIKVWLGDGFKDSYVLLIILIISLTMAMSQEPGVRLLFATAKHRYYAISNGIEGVMNLLLSLVLVRYYGKVGVALGTAISMIGIRLFLQPFFVCKACSISLTEYYSTYIPTVLKCTFLVFFSFWLIESYLVADYVWIVLLGMAYSVIFLMSSFWVVLNKNERKCLTDFARELFQGCK